MKRTRITRVISLLAVVAMLVAYTPAFAETVYATGIVTTDTDLYQTVSGTTGTTVLCTINSGSSVSIHSMTSNAAFYRVTVTTSSTSYTGYVAYADVRLSTSTTTSSPTVAYYDANGNPVYSYSGSTTTTTTSSTSSTTSSTTSTGTTTEYYINGVLYTGTVGGTASSGTTATTGTTGTTSTSGTTATVVNCTSWVSLRQAASSGSNRLAKVNKGTTVTINGTSGSYSYVTVNGQNGYILSTYLSTGTTSSTSSTGTTVAAGATSATYASQVTTNYTNSALKYDDCVGYIMVPGTNISHPIMFSSSLYYDTHTPDGAKTSAASIYAYSNTLTNVTVVAGHNLRVSKTMFHALHDVQNALLSSSSSANTTFYIKMGDYTTWQLFAMYETKATEPSSTLTYNTMNAMSLSGSDLASWINYQVGRSQVNFSTTATSADAGKLMVLVTCGDNYDSSTAQSRLYMFLKAVA